MGVNIEHKFNDKFIIGGSLINMRERPYTQKANYGQEPVNNTIFGFGGTYSTELPFLTRLLNKVPSLQSDVPSNISVRGEVAFLRPSAPKSTVFRWRIYRLSRRLRGSSDYCRYTRLQSLVNGQYSVAFWSGSLP